MLIDPYLEILKRENFVGWKRKSVPKVEEWERKKCKSCYNFTMAYQQCSRNPNNKACELYCKRKK